MHTQTDFLSSFLKASLLTALLIGGLLAQSYATTALFTGVSMNMDVEFKSTDEELSLPPLATTQVQNHQESTFMFGNHQVKVKTNFITSEQNSPSPESFLAELKLEKLVKEGEFINISSPSLMIKKDNWAEFKIAPSEDRKSIEFKLKYEDLQPNNDEHSAIHNTEWLNWGDSSVDEDVC
jgi:hypothetical protein